MGFLASIFKTLDKNQVIRHIESEVSFSIQYFVMLLLSVIIATLGLIINNNAIIIGAMLLSPLIWPIIGISLATVRSKKNLMKKSFVLLALSLFLIVLTAYVISLLSPFKEISLEMQSRVNPTIYDLLIALAAGLAATLILTWPKFSDALAGVAIAASLLPPICVTGIGLAFQNQDMAYGSFVLFLTNLSSIIFAGIIVFSFAQFYRRDDNGYVKRLSIGLLASIIVIAVIGGQLLLSLKQIIYEDTTQKTIRAVMSEELQKISGLIHVERVSMGALSDDVLNITSDIKSPVNVLITVNQKNAITEKLASRLDKNINLKMNITQVLEAVTYDEKQEKVQQAEGLIAENITNFASDISGFIEVQSIDSSINFEEESFLINTVWQVPDSVDVSISQKNLLEKNLSLLLDGEVNLRISIMRYFTLGETGDLEEIGSIENTKNILQEHTQGYIISQQDKLNIRYDYVEVDYDQKNFEYTIRLGVIVPQGKKISQSYIGGLKNVLHQVFSPVEALRIQVESQDYRVKNY